jgi:outer membrane protein TolC
MLNRYRPFGRWASRAAALLMFFAYYTGSCSAQDSNAAAPSAEELGAMAENDAPLEVDNPWEADPGAPDISGDLPFGISDATTASLLMQATQRIIEATQVDVPSGSRPLSLLEVVEQTLRNNLQIRSARLNPEIVGTQIDAEISVFDPVMFANASVSRNNNPSVGFLSTGNIDDATGVITTPEVRRTWNSYKGTGTQDGLPGIGVTRRFVSGLETTASIDFNRTDSSVDFFQPFDQNYNTEAQLDIIQPLCRGYGPNVNLAPVRIAFNDRQISEENLRFLTQTIIANAHSFYWALVFSRVNLAINQQSLALAADLLRENRIRYKYGDLIAVEVFEAEAGVKEREQAVIAAENDLANRMDDVRELIHVDRTDPNWEIPLVPIEPAEFHPVEVDEDLSLALALDLNPEIRIASLDIRNAGENLLLAQDAFKPQLDLFARIRENGLGETWTESNDNLFSGDYTSWQLGLSFSMALKRRRELANIRAAELQRQQAQLSLNEIEQRVVYNHRQAIRTIESLSRQVLAAQASVRAERDRLEKQRIGHEQGVTTSHDLLEVQEDFAQAQVREVSAIVDYYFALIALEAIRGTLLDSLGFEFVRMAPR